MMLVLETGSPTRAAALLATDELALKFPQDADGFKIWPGGR